MNEAAANISWLPCDPRDWEQLTPAFGRLRSMVGAHGPKLIANNRAAAFFDRCVHEGRLELALVAPDLTYRLFDAAERQKLTIRVPLNYEEGCSIEPYHEGHWYVQRSNLEKLTAIPVTLVARAEAELVPARTPPAEPASAPPAESLRVEPGRDVGAADGPVHGMQAEPGGPQLLSAALKPTTAADVGDQAGAANPSQPPQAQRQPSPQAVTSKESPSPDKRLNDPAVGIQASARAQSTSEIQSETPAAAPHPGGRPFVVNWSMVDEEVFRLMNDNGEFSVDDPEWNAQARLENAIADFCETKFGIRPGETTIKDHIREPLRRWRQSRSET